MLFDPRIAVRLLPDEPAFPYRPILEGLMARAFEPDACRAWLESVLAERPELEGLLLPHGVESGGALVGEPLLFPQPATSWLLSFASRDGDATTGVEVEVEAEGLAALGPFFRAAAGGVERATFLETYGEGFDGELAGLLRSAGDPGARAALPSDAPGLVRREHACLEVRTRTASIVIDPLSAMVGFPNMGALPDALLSRRHDGVLLTHTHADHWHLPTLAVSAIGAPVVAPAVSRRTLLAPQDVATLAMLRGGEVIPTAWGATIAFGDIVVDVLPFFGEQPSRDRPTLDPSLRNKGNCYRIQTEAFSVLVLVDSGADPEGDMVRAVEESARARGSVDLVVACTREFPAPFFGGLERDWAALPFEALRELFEQYEAGRLRSSTAGPDLIAAVCRAASARWFLPYANGFEGYGRTITDVGWGYGEPSEEEMLQRTAAALSECGAPTSALSWHCGDRLDFSSVEPTVEPYGA
jgi:hypothetical protein